MMSKDLEDFGDFSSSDQYHPGTYALILTASHQKEIAVGMLGRLSVQPGYYVYIGSAFGSGGVHSRLVHHINRASKLHWHIDYLRGITEIVEIWYTHDPHKREHEWALIFQEMPLAVIPLLNFGASDCRCPAHLFYFTIIPDITNESPRDFYLLSIILTILSRTRWEASPTMGLPCAKHKVLNSSSSSLLRLA